jgi:hypothetical protein
MGVATGSLDYGYLNGDEIARILSAKLENQKAKEGIGNHRVN